MNKFIRENIRPVSKIIARKLKVSQKTVETVLLLGIPILLNLVSKKKKARKKTRLRRKKYSRAKRRHHK